MPRLTNWYCGIRWYFSNSATQACWDSGGRAPVTGRHSVIDRPEPVSRVAPPTITMAMIMAATTNSQRATAWDRSRL